MAMWNFTGNERPDFADLPGKGQESVWDYPRPPSLRADLRRVRVVSDGEPVAESGRSYRVCETASPPTFYLPPGDVNFDLLVSATGTSVCEWKGAARYWALASEPAIVVGWSYPRPRGKYGKLKDCVAFYPGRLDCFVDEERVRPQPGRFYGGWITSDVAGPFKGEPGSNHW